MSSAIGQSGQNNRAARAYETSRGGGRSTSVAYANSSQEKNVRMPIDDGDRSRGMPRTASGSVNGSGRAGYNGKMSRNSADVNYNDDGVSKYDNSSADWVRTNNNTNITNNNNSNSNSNINNNNNSIMNNNNAMSNSPARHHNSVMDAKYDRIKREASKTGGGSSRPGSVSALTTMDMFDICWLLECFG